VGNVFEYSLLNSLIHKSNLHTSSFASATQGPQAPGLLQFDGSNPRSLLSIGKVSIHGLVSLYSRRCKIFTCAKFRFSSVSPRTSVHPSSNYSPTVSVCLPASLSLISVSSSALVHRSSVLASPFFFSPFSLVNASPRSSSLPTELSPNRNVIYVCSCQPSRTLLSYPCPESRSTSLQT
jgi:hypothetical protein